MIILVEVGIFYVIILVEAGFFFKLALSIRMFNRAVILDISKCIQPTSIHEVFNQINSAPV